MRSMLSGLLVVCVLAGCGGGGGIAGSSPGSSSSCNIEDPTSCSGERVCSAGSRTCEPVFPHTYDLSGLVVSLPPRDPRGDCWDVDIVGCGAPDPFIVVKLDGERIGKTGAKKDTRTGSFSNSFTIELFDDFSLLGLEVWDEDLSEHDRAFTCELELSATNLRGAGNYCDPGGARLEFRIVPR